MACRRLFANEEAGTVKMTDRYIKVGENPYVQIMIIIKNISDSAALKGKMMKKAEERRKNTQIGKKGVDFPGVCW